MISEYAKILRRLRLKLNFRTCSYALCPKNVGGFQFEAFESHFPKIFNLSNDVVMGNYLNHFEAMLGSQKYNTAFK